MVNCAIPHRPVRHGLNGSLNYFLETVFNYPTLAECYKVAALDAYNKLSL
jgi:NAD(P) transhydrogenase|tara:strand:+ start:8103 stop:8252 length:150 start_codon:yes stop_codon:yes gene_type:complete